MASVPALIVVLPVNELLPESVNVPVPALVRANAPVPVFRIVPAKMPLRFWLLPIVSVTAVLLLLITLGVPGAALVFRLEMTMFLPLRFKLAVLKALGPKTTAFSEPAVALSAPLLPSVMVPLLIVTPPVNVLV